MMKYVKMALGKYADFSGRSRRSEYWYFNLFLILGYAAFVGLAVSLSEVHDALGGMAAIGFGIFALGSIIPTLSVTVRRLHDTGKSGWFYLVSLLPFGGFVLFFFMLQDSQEGSNKWGPNPKKPQVGTYDEADDIGRHLLD